jgi:hypothetical protein
MAIEWTLGLKSLPVVQPIARWVSNRAFGKQPTIDFSVGDYGPDLRIKNIRAETIVI